MNRCGFQVFAFIIQQKYVSVERASVFFVADWICVVFSTEEAESAVTGCCLAI